VNARNVGLLWLGIHKLILGGKDVKIPPFIHKSNSQQKRCCEQKDDKPTVVLDGQKMFCNKWFHKLPVLNGLANRVFLVVEAFKDPKDTGTKFIPSSINFPGNQPVTLRLTDSLKTTTGFAQNRTSRPNKLFLVICGTISNHDIE
jgi:hypothetical protein